MGPSVQVMEDYALLREDLDNILELAQWPDSPDPMRAVESKVKAAFTRAYNKQVFLPYSTNVGNVAKKVRTHSVLASSNDNFDITLE